MAPLNIALSEEDGCSASDNGHKNEEPGDQSKVLTSVSGSNPLSFEQHLSQLNSEWNSVVSSIESSCVENENIAKKWWDFSKLKKKVSRWITMKEESANDTDGSSDNSFDSIKKNANKYKVH